MPWQQQVVDVALEVDDDGRWAYSTVVVTVQRQSGKTTLIFPVGLHRAITKSRSLSWYTAQTRQDGRDNLMPVAEQALPRLGVPKNTLRRSNGSEGLYLPNGSSFRLFAPTEDALHGKANELVVVDEGWAFPIDRGLALAQAIVPTFTTTGGQLWLPSTQGTAESLWFHGYVDMGRALVDDHARTGTYAGRLALFDFGVPDDVDLTGLAKDATPIARQYALDQVLAHHPARDHTLRMDALEGALDQMEPGEFARAFANRRTATAEQKIPAPAWQACRATSWPEPTVPVALAFDCALDGSSGVITACWRDTPDAPLRWDVVDERPGTSWLAPALLELRQRRRPVAIAHNGGPALDVADDLERAGVRLLGLDAGKYVTACASVLADVIYGRISHPDHPALNAAVEAAADRTLGEGWAWSRRKSASSIAPLVAATCASYAYEHAKSSKPIVVTSRRRTL